MKLLFFCATALFTKMFSYAADEPKDPVFMVSFSNSFPKTGDIIEVILKAEVPEGLNMYSTYNKCVIGPLKLDIRFVSHKSYQLIGDTYSIGDKKKQDEVFKCELGQFDKQAEVRQKIKILSADVMINGTIEGQWCTENACYSFGSLTPVSFSSILKAKSSKSTPSSKKHGSKNTKTINQDLMISKPSDYYKTRRMVKS